MTPDDSLPGDPSASDEINEEQIDQLLQSLQGASAPPGMPPGGGGGSPSPDEIDALLSQIGAPAPGRQPATDPMAGASPMQFEPLGQPSGETIANNMDLLMDVSLNVKIELGRAKMTLEELLRLGRGAVVELDRLAGDPLNIYVNDRLAARGEVLVLNDNFCIRITEIVHPSERTSWSGS